MAINTAGLVKGVERLDRGVLLNPAMSVKIAPCFSLYRYPTNGQMKEEIGGIPQLNCRKGCVATLVRIPVVHSILGVVCCVYGWYMYGGRQRSKFGRPLRV